MAMSDAVDPRPALRLYTAEECGPDGYPKAWHRGCRPDASGVLMEYGHAAATHGIGVKHHVRQVADFRCARCQHRYVPGDGEWSVCDERCLHSGEVRTVGGQVEARWRILTVHHLLVGDVHKRDLRWWNLAPLCQRCHLVIQAKVRLHQVWPHEHSEWFRPYAAGWYAWSYLGEDLSREETMGRLDELLALELVT